MLSDRTAPLQRVLGSRQGCLPARGSLRQGCWHSRGPLSWGCSHGRGSAGAIPSSPVRHSRDSEYPSVGPNVLRLDLGSGRQGSGLKETVRARAPMKSREGTSGPGQGCLRWRQRSGLKQAAAGRGAALPLQLLVALIAWALITDTALAEDQVSPLPMGPIRWAPLNRSFLSWRYSWNRSPTVTLVRTNAVFSTVFVTPVLVMQKPGPVLALLTASFPICMCCAGNGAGRDHVRPRP